MKRFVGEHSGCTREESVRHMTSEWLAKNYINEYIIHPNMKVNKFKSNVLKRHQLGVSKHKAYIVQKRAKNMIDGTISQQFVVLYNYAEELRVRNPGTTIVISPVQGTLATGRPVFERMYVCLGACKGEFKHYRPLIGLDGCFLKVPYEGILLLNVVGIDGNNMFPIAWAQVESENTTSWT